MIDPKMTAILNEKKSVNREALLAALAEEGIEVRQEDKSMHMLAFRPECPEAECPIQFEEERDHYAPWEHREHRTGKLKLCIIPDYRTDEKRQTFPELKVGGFSWPKVVGKVSRAIEATQRAQENERLRNDRIAVARSALEGAALDLGLQVERYWVGDDRLQGVGDVAEPRGSGKVRFAFESSPEEAKRILTLLAELGIAKKEAPDAD